MDWRWSSDCVGTKDRREWRAVPLASVSRRVSCRKGDEESEESVGTFCLLPEVVGGDSAKA